MSRTVRGGAVLLAVLCLVLVVGWPAGPGSSQADRGAGDRGSNDQAELDNFFTASRPQPVHAIPSSALWADEEESGAFPRRYKAPSLDGGVEWINSGGPIDLKQLRGKFVLLDFWTYCCINCMHILPTLKKLEHAYPNELVVIGVHSAKFEAEQDSKNITDAVLRYGIEHPVINDSQHKIWEKFEISSWPSFRVIDPEGYVIAGQSGEVDFETLNQFLKKAIANYKKRGLIDETPVHFNREADRTPDTPLRFPGKILADSAHNRLFIADTAHNRIVVARPDGTLLETIGSGEAGSTDGDFSKATFDHPQGMAVVDETLYVADTENHLLRRVDLKKHNVSTLAGTGKQGEAWPGNLSGQPPLGKARKTPLSSPWALWVRGGHLYIAMAGTHQIWRMQLPHGDIGPYAGNGREDIVDGALLPATAYEQGFSSFAQPSGLSGDDAWLYVADSEGSSIRAVPFDSNQTVRTVVGTAGMRYARLFTFGDVDGQGEQVRLQHPLDVAGGGNLLYVADTYNNKIKAIDLSSGTCKTLAGSLKPGTADSPAQFDEPGGLSLAEGQLYVADTNNHLIRVIDLATGETSTLSIAGLTVPAPKSHAPAKPSFPGAVAVKVKSAKVKPVDGKLRLHVALSLPSGYKINDLAPLRYLVEAEGGAGPVEASALGQLQKSDKHQPQLDIDLPLSAASGQATLKISCGYYYCQQGSEGVCKAAAVVWTVPVEIAADATSDVVALTAPEPK